MKTFLKGGLDELMIYNRELSALEALALWDQNAAMAKVEQQNDPDNQALVQVFYLQQVNPGLQQQKVVRPLDAIQLFQAWNDLPVLRD